MILLLSCHETAKLWVSINIFNNQCPIEKVLNMEIECGFHFASMFWSIPISGTRNTYIIPPWHNDAETFITTMTKLGNITQKNVPSERGFENISAWFFWNFSDISATRTPFCTVSKNMIWFVVVIKNYFIIQV